MPNIHPLVLDIIFPSSQVQVVAQRAHANIPMEMLIKAKISYAHVYPL